MSIENEIDTNKIPIGMEVTIFRTLLDCTQQEFANLLFLSRATVNKLEQSRDINTLSLDIAFRLYYATQKIIDNPFKENYVKSHAQQLQDNIDLFLQSHTYA